MVLTFSKETSFTLQALLGVKTSMLSKLAKLFRICLVSTGHGSTQLSRATLILVNQQAKGQTSDAIAYTIIYWHILHHSSDLGQSVVIQPLNLEPQFKCINTVWGSFPIGKCEWIALRVSKVYPMSRPEDG